MKVLLINGSPHEHGCTYTALAEIAGALAEEGIDSEILQAGRAAIRGCMACGGCRSTGRCVYADDPVNEAIEKMAACDGLIVGSPVHYASAGGAITALLDRMFYASAASMRGKPGAAICSARRAGTTATLDQLSKYFIISGMPIVPSQYWPMVHGSNAQEVLEDEEGMQTMRMLGRNMAWMLKAFALAAQHGVTPPERETPRKWTNFIR
ncbi:MAG: flavodoxin family protein [Clostridia bacterium]|nr:flavodoxin family protein [Clostridia bacterium]